MIGIDLGGSVFVYQFHISSCLSLKSSRIGYVVQCLRGIHAMHRHSIVSC